MCVNNALRGVPTQIGVVLAQGYNGLQFRHRQQVGHVSRLNVAVVGLDCQHDCRAREHRIGAEVAQVTHQHGVDVLTFEGRDLVDTQHLHTHMSQNKKRHWWQATSTQPALLRRALLSGNPADLLPLARTAYEALEHWLRDSAVAHFVTRDWQLVLQSNCVWQLRFLIFTAMHCSDTFVLLLFTRSPYEQHILPEFVDILTHEMNLMLRGGSDFGEGHLRKYSGPQDFTTRMAVEYLSL